MCSLTCLHYCEHDVPMLSTTCECIEKANKSWMRGLGGGEGSHLVSLGLTFELTRTHLDSFTWTHSDSIGITWIHLSHGLTWTYLDSLGIAWFHLDSFGFTDIHLDPSHLARENGNTPGSKGDKGRCSDTISHLDLTRRPDCAHTHTHDTKRVPGWTHRPNVRYIYIYMYIYI